MTVVGQMGIGTPCHRKQLTGDSTRWRNGTEHGNCPLHLLHLICPNAPACTSSAQAGGRVHLISPSSASVHLVRHSSASPRLPTARLPSATVVCLSPVRLPPVRLTRPPPPRPPPPRPPPASSTRAARPPVLVRLPRPAPPRPPTAGPPRPP
jgi:hypothetical protein